MNRSFLTTDKQNQATAPRQPGCLGETLTALVRSLQLATQNKTTAKDEWDRARLEAAQHWRQGNGR